MRKEIKNDWNVNTLVGVKEFDFVKMIFRISRGCLFREQRTSKGFTNLVAVTNGVEDCG